MKEILLKFQLICVAFYVKNTNCAQITDAEDASHLKISACIAECKSLNTNNDTNIIEVCYHDCVEISKDRVLNFSVINADAKFDLYCRDPHSLKIKIDHNGEGTNETFLYLLKVKESTGDLIDRIYVFSDEKLINVTVDDLGIAEATTLSYDITAYIISATNSTVLQLKQQKFTTLSPDYKPKDVTQILAKNWTEYYDEFERERRLNFTFTWQPEEMKTCSYEVLFYGDDFELDAHPVSLENLYEYTMTNLKYGTEYSVAIRAINSYNPLIHSQDCWFKFDSPEGEIPLEVSATVEHIENNLFDVKVTWNEPLTHPKYYHVMIKNFHDSENKEIYTTDVDGDATFHVFKNARISSASFLINITGFSENGNVYVHDYDFIDTPVIHQNKYQNILFYVFVALIAVLMLLVLILWKGKKADAPTELFHSLNQVGK